MELLEEHRARNGSETETTSVSTASTRSKAKAVEPLEEAGEEQEESIPKIKRSSAKKEDEVLSSAEEQTVEAESSDASAHDESESDLGIRNRCGRRYKTQTQSHLSDLQ